jgi:Tol biopolymer transport system component
MLQIVPRHSVNALRKRFMKSGTKSIVRVLARLGSKALTGALMAALAWQLPTRAAFAQTRPAIELEAAIAKEQVDGDLKTAVAAYLKIAADTSASRDVRARALLHLAGCYEKLGQQAQKVYEQTVRDFADQPAAAQARARLASYSARQLPALKELKPERLTANTPELPIHSAVLSRDGKSLAYSDALGIHVRPVAGGETRLLPGTQGQMLAQWAADGNSLQTQLLDAAGVGTNMVVTLRGVAPSSVPASDQSVPSPDGTHRVLVSEDLLTLSVQDAHGNSRERWKAAANTTLGQFQWSPNGKWIAVSSWVRNSQLSTLEAIEIASGRKRVLVPVEKKLFLRAIVWASQNRMIVAIDESRGVYQNNSNLWELRLDDSGALISGGLRRLTSWADFPIRSGSLTTDGKRLLFIRSFQQRDVYVAPLEAGGTRMGTPRRLTLDLGDDYPTGWTRDSKTVIITSDRNGTQAMFRQDLDKQTADQIVVMPGIHTAAPRVTPDGKSLLFHINPAQKDFQLMRVPIAGGTPEPVPNTAHVRFDYRCAPDSICVMAQLQNQEYPISELDSVKGKGREIYRDDHLGTFDLSPDGKWIALLSESGSETKITLRSTATGAVAREIPVRGMTRVLSLVYALDGKGFFLADGSFTEVRELHVDLDGKVSVLWHQPAAAGSIWGHPSPDGKYLALVMSTDESNVYMVENF